MSSVLRTGTLLPRCYLGKEGAALEEIEKEVNLHEQRRTYQNAQLLQAFWERARRATSRQGRLSLLHEMTYVELAPDPFVEHSTQAGRRGFEKRKARGHFRLKGWCWLCRGETPDHRHHVIPVKAGGRNRAGNIVLLCETCHRAVHRRKDA